jgi:sirohydrochlorin ferrochelatase
VTTADGPVLVACAHGTRGPLGRRTVGSLVAAVAEARPGLDVAAAFVDVQPPEVADVVRRVTDAGRRAVVVPLLLSAGYHVNVDIGRATAGPGARSAGALGPDVRLTQVLLDRLREAGARDGDAVVLAAAGSSDERSGADVDQVAAVIRSSWSGPVLVGYGASARPSVPEAVAQARELTEGRVAVAAYLLAPGFFHDRLQKAGADVVTGPLAVDASGRIDPRLVQVVLDRYDAAVQRWPARTPSDNTASVS